MNKEIRRNNIIPIINKKQGLDIIACINMLENGVKNIYLTDEQGKYQGECICRSQCCVIEDGHGEWKIDFVKLPSIRFDKPITSETEAELINLAEQTFIEYNVYEELPVVNSLGKILSLAGKKATNEEPSILQWDLFTVLPKDLREKKIFVSSFTNPRLEAFVKRFKGELNIECLTHENLSEAFSHSSDKMLIYENDFFPECNKYNHKKLYNDIFQDLLIVIDDWAGEVRKYFQNGPALCLVSSHDSDMLSLNSLRNYNLRGSMAIIVPDEFEIEKDLEQLGIKRYVHFHEIRSLNLSVEDVISGLKNSENGKFSSNRYKYIQDFPFVKGKINDEYNFYKHKFSVATIMKDAGLYLKEWIDYHLLSGVDHFYFYDHESVDATKEILQPYIDEGLVDYYVWPDEMGLMSAYNDVLVKSRFETEYLAIIDDDEFLLPLVNVSIPDLIDHIFKENISAGGLCVTWRLFGSSGHVKTPPEGTLHAFCKREDDEKLRARHGKLVINPRRVLYMLDPHYAEYVAGYCQINEYGECLFRNFNTRHDRLICLNHYIVKSVEEWKIRRGRIPADNRKSSMRPNNQFAALDSFTNSIYDDSILRYVAVRRKDTKVYNRNNIYAVNENYHSYIDKLFGRIISHEGMVERHDIEQLYTWFYNCSRHDFESKNKMPTYAENLFYICLEKLIKTRLLNVCDLQVIYAFLLHNQSKYINELLCANLKDILSNDALLNYVGLSPKLSNIYSLLCARVDIRCSEANKLRVLPWGERNLVRIDTSDDCTGVTVHGWDRVMLLRIICTENDTITLSLRGLDVQDKNNSHYPLKVTYTSVLINYSVDKLSTPIDVTYEKDYKITFSATKDKDIFLIVRYIPYKYSNNELMSILSFLSKSSFVREM